MTFPTEIINENDLRAKEQVKNDAVKKEVQGLFKRGTFKVMLKGDVLDEANILPGRFILAIKSTEDVTTKYKARFVIGGHRDKHKNLMVHNSTTLQPQSIGFLLAMGQCHNFDVWTTDITQTYLSVSDPLLRDIFLNKIIRV